MSAVPAIPSLDQEPVPQRPDAPRSPENLDDVGLAPDAVRDLMLKALYVQGSRTGQELAEYVCLPFGLVDEELLTLQQRRFIEVRGTTGPNRASYRFDLGAEGRARAKDALEASQYVGPVPVPLSQYRAWIAAQSIRHAHVTQQVMRDGFDHLVLDEELFEMLGPAVNSSKSIFLYGHPGNGKTAIAEAVSKMLGGSLYIPYAVDIDGQIMTVFDGVHHQEIEPEGGYPDDKGIWLRTGSSYDRRYALIKRPVVVTGGELSMEQLDLQYDPFTKLYQAPFQVKANGGVLIVDDFGRQRVPPRDLLNRWIVPLEKRVDYLTLHTGGKFPIPFDCLLIFATNLDPADLVEEAFLRRIHYKISVDNPSKEGYEEIFRRCCDGLGIAFEPAALAQIYRDFYDGMNIPARACHPRDILSHVCDIAKYRETKPRLTRDLVDMACRSYFLSNAQDH